MDDVFAQLINEHLAVAESFTTSKGHLWGFPPTTTTTPPERVSGLTLVCGPWHTQRTQYGVEALGACLARGVEPRNTLYLNCTDPRLPKKLGRGTLARMIELYFTHALRDRQEPFYLFLDNAEAAPDWLEFSRALIDTYPAHVWVADARRSWTLSSFTSKLPSHAAVVELKGLSTSDVLRRLSSQAAAQGKENPLKFALEQFYLFGREACSGEANPLTAIRQRVIECCSHDIARMLPTTPLALIERTAALLCGQAGSAPSLTVLRHSLADEGLPTTRATLTHIAEALSEAHLLVRPPLFHMTSNNPHAARFAFASDHSIAQAFTAGGLSGEARVASVVFSQLYEEDATSQLQTKRLADQGILLAWDLPSGQREHLVVHTRPKPSKRFLTELDEQMAYHKTKRFTVITPDTGWALQLEHGTLEATPLGEWLLERTGILA